MGVDDSEIKALDGPARRSCPIGTHSSDPTVHHFFESNFDYSRLINLTNTVGVTMDERLSTVHIWFRVPTNSAICARPAPHSERQRRVLCNCNPRSTHSSFFSRFILSTFVTLTKNHPSTIFAAPVVYIVPLSVGTICCHSQGFCLQKPRCVSSQYRPLAVRNPIIQRPATVSKLEGWPSLNGRHSWLNTLRRFQHDPGTIARPAGSIDLPGCLCDCEEP